MPPETHASLHLALYDFYIHTEMCFVYMFTLLEFNKVFWCERKDCMFMCLHVYDVALW